MAQRIDERTRRNIVELHLEGRTKAEISRRLMIAGTSVCAIVRLREETGGVAPRPQKRGPRHLVTEEDLVWIKCILDYEPGMPVRRINEMMQLGVCGATLYKAIRKRLGYSYKKKSRQQQAQRRGRD